MSLSPVGLPEKTVSSSKEESVSGVYYYKVLMHLVHQYPGWVPKELVTHPPMYHYTITLLCPHGQDLKCIVSYESLLWTDKTGASQMAVSHFLNLISTCVKQHALLNQFEDKLKYTTYEDKYKLLYGIQLPNNAEAHFTLPPPPKGFTVSNANDIDPHGANAKVAKAFPGIKKSAMCPASDCEGKYSYTPISSLIPHLNDNHRWTREQIADWLETLDIDLTYKSEEEQNANQEKQIIETIPGSTGGVFSIDYYLNTIYEQIKQPVIGNVSSYW